MTAEQKKSARDEYFYVLDVLNDSGGGQPQHSRETVAQVVGEDYFSLLEVIPLPGISIKTADRILVGKSSEDRVYSQILRIRRSISYDDLTPVAKRELGNVLEIIIDLNESKFVRFFNEAKPLTVKMHELELIPGIGKKLMWEIITQREQKPFESLEDLQNRVKIANVKKKIIERIIKELTGGEKYRIFAVHQRYG